ncbi:MAG: hypothetical protein AAF253_01610 [Pseudomonadota bacterium]
MIGLITLALVSLAIAARGIFGRKRAFEFPTALALLYIAFIIPQAMAVERTLSVQFETWFVWFYMALCLLMVTFGFEGGKAWAARRAQRFMPPQQLESRLIIGAIGFAFIGLFASSQVRTIAAATELGSQWTGVITLWYLLIQTTFFALALASLRFLKSRNQIYTLVALVALAAILVMVSQNVKRHMIAEVAIIFAGAWFFMRGQQPSKPLLLVGFLLGTVLLHQVGSVRNYIDEGRGNAFQAFAEGVPFEKFEYFNADRGPEVTQAVVDISATNQTGLLEGPADLWNKLVHQYVPAFIFGREFKDSLKVEEGIASRDNYELLEFESRGATRTGFSDTYRSYSVFGCLIFLGLGVFMGALYSYALNGRLWAQFYYLVLLNDGMIAVTESTSRFMVTLPMMFVLTWIVVRPIARGRAVMRSGPPGARGANGRLANGAASRPAWQGFRV